MELTVLEVPGTGTQCRLCLLSVLLYSLDKQVLSRVQRTSCLLRSFPSWILLPFAGSLVPLLASMLLKYMTVFSLARYPHGQRVYYRLELVGFSRIPPLLGYFRRNFIIKDFFSWEYYSSILASQLNWLVVITQSMLVNLTEYEDSVLESSSP
jgi:hypothetical protein